MKLSVTQSFLVLVAGGAFLTSCKMNQHEQVAESCGDELRQWREEVGAQMPVPNVDYNDRIREKKVKQRTDNEISGSHIGFPGGSDHGIMYRWHKNG